MTWLPVLPATRPGGPPTTPVANRQPAAARAATVDARRLLASGCGTAVAAVCASGLVVLTQQAPGLWAGLAVLCGGGLAWALARCLARLAEHIPGGAGLLAYLARPLGRQAALLLALPYFLLSLFLVGAEATLVGQLAAQLVPGPPLAFALAFVLATWLLCRRGVQISLRAQALCTWTLLAGLSLCALLSLAQVAVHGQLAARLWTPPPSSLAMLGAIAQSLFLFMGFELITSQTAPLPAATLRRALVGSVGILTAFYALLALAVAAWGVASLGSQPLLPQLALAQKTAGRPAVATIALLSLLASYTSFNGALLAFSRLSAVLASLGILPRSWAQVDGRSLLPQRALAGLLLLCLGATVLVHGAGLLLAVVVAAAPTAAVVYAAIAWARASLPAGAGPSTPNRARWHRAAAHTLSLILAGLAIAVLVSLPRAADPEAGVASSPAAGPVLRIVAAAYAVTLALMFRQRRRPPRARR